MAYPLVLDPSCGKGEFLLESAKRMAARGCRDVLNQLWAADFTRLNLLIARKRLENWAKNTNNNQQVVDFVNMIEYNSVEDLGRQLAGMKFDVVVGNPPYQKSGESGRSKGALYHQFVDLAKKLNPEIISMVIPSRWFAGGNGLDRFRETMMADKSLKMLIDYPDSSQFFPTTEIKGGVSHFLWERAHSLTKNPKCLVRNIIDGKVVDESLRDLNEFDVIIRYGKDLDIFRKIHGYSEPSISDNISAVRPFGIPSNFSKYSKAMFLNATKIYLRGGIGWIDSSLILKNFGWVKKHKTLISKAYNGGEKFNHTIIGKPIVAESGSACTETYIVCGYFDTKQEAENLAAYIKTRLFRFLVSLRKNSQDVTKDRFKFVPDLPMTETWTDEKLCKRWGITTEEFAYITSRIKEMI